MHIVFDDYPQPSIKETERNRRGEDDRTYVITGPQQRRVPKDMNDALKSTSFKKELPQFLAKERQDQSYASVLGDCEVYLDVPGNCYKFYIEHGIMKRNTVDELRNNHEEADIKTCLHARAADCKNGEIVVRASDTDIAVILLYHCSKFDATLWMDVGVASIHNRCYISITRIYELLGPQLCTSLPGFHALTGSDYTFAFVRKGKIRPFKILAQSTEYQRAFRCLSSGRTISLSTITILQKFTSVMYGAKANRYTTLNSYRYQKFVETCGPKEKGQHPLSKLKGIDSSSLPPCEAEVNTHIKRASFVANMWARADKNLLQQHPAKENGWEITNGHYQLIWFEGEQLPESLIPEEEEFPECEEDDIDAVTSCEGESESSDDDDDEDEDDDNDEH